MATPSLTDYKLDAKYTVEEGTVYLSGVQALVRLPMEQHRADRRRGLRTATFISGYRGSPLGGYDQQLEREAALLRQHEVFFVSGLNEDLAATAVFGSQMVEAFPHPKYDGVLGMWYGKAPGVDRSGDALKHANYAGVGKNGGVLALAGDDPLCKSSTLPSHSEPAFFDALIPVLYPGNAQEILDLGLHGFTLSRHSGLWAAMKLVTNVADEAATVQVGPGRVEPVIPTVELDGRPFQHQISLTALAPSSIEMERTLHYARLELARRYAYENRLNQVVVPTRDAWLGILTAGKSYYDVRDALQHLGLDEAELERRGIRILKMGMLFPMEPRIVREFAAGLEEIVVVEEKRAFLELFAKEALYGGPDQPRVVGKFDEAGAVLLQAHGELDADSITRALARRIQRRIDIPSVANRIAYLDRVQNRPAIPMAAARTPYFCSGCPHNRSTVLPEGSLGATGIGCHAMVVLTERKTIGATQMGGDGAQWIGIAPFTETPHFFQNVGDGTFFHSGGLALDFAVASGVNLTYKILYNSAVAMTGGQAAIGELPVPQLTRKLEASGVKKIIVTSDDPDKYQGVALSPIAEVWHRDDIIKAQEALRTVQGVTVLVHDQQCAAEKRRLRRRGRQAAPAQRVFINERVCEGCGDCGVQSNCMSVQPLETEFGRKTAIDQGSCNQDFSCLLGHCPSFITVVPGKAAAGKRSAPPRIDRPLPEPARIVPDEDFTIHMMGIGGTGVVTVNQILGTAALLDGRQARSLDQTGLAQKGGPVVSDLRVFGAGTPISNTALAGGADLYLGFDVLVAATPANLEMADPTRTVAVISTTQVPTGGMVGKVNAAFPEASALRGAIDGVTRSASNVYLDAHRTAEALFGDPMASNLLLLGAAYQAGAIPIAAAAIEQAVRLNGVQVDMNLAAFNWGRLAVVDPERVAAAVSRTRPPVQPLRERPAVRALVDAAGVTGEARRLLEVRVPELVDYQDEGYARRYVDFVARVHQVEQRATPGRTAVTEAVARHLFKLMAYKDEYEVARLHLDPAMQQRVEQEFGPGASITWHFQPPVLERFGRLKKTRFGGWFRPVLVALRSMKGLRGTPFDPFGNTPARRLDRALVNEYRQLVEAGLERLTPETHATVAALAALPDGIRGYEHVRFANVQRFRAEADQLLAALEAPAAGLAASI